MPKGVVEKQPNRAAVWTFQEAEAVGGSEVDSFNSKVNGKVNTLQQQGRKSVHYVVKQIHFLHHTSGLYLPNAEITLDLEVNEVEVKVLTSLASVTEITVCEIHAHEVHAHEMQAREVTPMKHMPMRCMPV